MPLIEGQGISKHFGGLAALTNVDFTVEQGEVLGLIGPNGAGKTTLFNVISASFPPTSGTIKFKGKNVTGFKPHQICRMGMARTFQSVKVFNNMSALHNVALGSYFGKKAKVSPEAAEQNAAELLAFVGLKSMKDTPAEDLTLANQKRLEVARALATKPELLLLDEVMEGLNHTEVAQAMELITKIQARGITVIMIEHVMKAIMNVCDRILVLHYGQKIAEGTPEEIASSEKVIEVYLGAGTC
jgi:branched-chain amino acid transport system ATP-binding protein